MNITCTTLNMLSQNAATCLSKGATSTDRAIATGNATIGDVGWTCVVSNQVVPKEIQLNCGM